MAQTTTLARPYAKAIFDSALGEGTLVRWSDTLAALLYIHSHPDIQKVIHSPDLNAQTQQGIFIALMEKQRSENLNPREANFVRILVETKRLPVLPDIAALYEKYRAEAEKTLKVDIVTAMPLNETQKQGFITRLHARFSREIQLHEEVDNELLGGAFIRIPAIDKVIDGSVRGLLERLAESLA